MAYKAIPLETRSCKGCGVEFQTTDPRKWFHKGGCGRAKFEKQTNAWLLVNRPNFPTEPCLTCGAPVVQYRKRRYDGDMRRCSTSCFADSRRIAGPTASELAKSKRMIRICSACKKPRHSYRPCKHCSKKKRLLLLQLRNRLRWLMPKQCTGCGETFNRYGQGWRCDSCKEYTDRQLRQIRRLRQSRNGAYDRGIDYKSLYDRAGGQCAICRTACADPSVWRGWDGCTWMPTAPTVDHIIPLAKGGSHTWANVQLACIACNSLKGDRATPGLCVI